MKYFELTRVGDEYTSVNYIIFFILGLGRVPNYNLKKNELPLLGNKKKFLLCIN